MLPETAIRRVAAGWAGVTATPVEAGADLAYGSVDFGRIRTGLVEAALPPRVREMTIETGRAEPAADRRWALVRVDSEDDVEPAVALLRLAYERARIALAVRDAQRPIS